MFQVKYFKVQFSSVQSLSHVRLFATPELQHARPPCPSPTPGVYSNSCSLSRWCHPAISSSVVPFFSCPQSLPASGSFPVSQLFAWDSQSTGVSALASVFPMNTQDWSPLECKLQMLVKIRVKNNNIIYILYILIGPDLFQAAIREYHRFGRF